MLRKSRASGWSLARQLFAVQAGIVLVVMIGALFAAVSNARQNSLNSARQTVLAIAQSVAATPTVRQALSQPDPSAVLQPFAEQVRRDTGTDFVVVMSVAGIRYTHPHPQEIGGRFLGHIEAATRGRAFTETYSGTLGPSVRAVVPVFDGDQIRGLVSVGIILTAVGREVSGQLPLLVTGAAVALLLAWLGSWLASRWLRHTTHDLGPVELRRMYDFYDAVLHSVREGLLLLDQDGRLRLANDEARRLLLLAEDAMGRRVDALGLPPRLGEALRAGVERADELHLTDDRILVVNQAPARWRGKVLGTVVTLRDQTELRALTTELDSIRGMADSLHAQAHEAANHLHSVISLIELGRPEQALEYATAELAVAQQFTDRVVGAVEEPVLAALLIGKAAQANGQGTELILSQDISVPKGLADPRDLVTIVGNLLDNALDAALAAPPPRWVKVSARAVAASADRGRDPHLVLRVADSGAGLDPVDVDAAFRRGWSTKANGRLPGRGLGLALTAQAVHRYGGGIEVRNEGGAVFTVRLPVARSLDTDGADRADGADGAAVVAGQGTP